MIKAITAFPDRDAPTHGDGNTAERNNAHVLKVAICATHPIQYQAPLWRRLAQRTDLEVKVFYGSDLSVRGYKDQEFGVTIKWDTPLLEGYSYEFISTDPQIKQIGFRSPGSRGLLPRLAEFAPDVVLITAYHGLFHLGAMFAARRLGARVVMRHEASDVAVTRTRWKGVIRDCLLRQLYARVDRFAAIGSEARQHLLRVGVAPARIGTSPYCVDSEFMERQAEFWLPQRNQLRLALGIEGNALVLIFSGKLIPKKDPLLIAAALALLPAQVLAHIHLIVAGDGDLRSELKRAMQEVLGARLHLLGFLNQAEIGRAYAAADVLVLPSKKGTGETWGLVVNEGMQYCLPAIVSDGVGCHADLVSEGRTGWNFQSGDAAGLARAIKSSFEIQSKNRQALGTAARSRVTDFSIEAAAHGLMDAFKFVARPLNYPAPSIAKKTRT